MRILLLGLGLLTFAACQNSTEEAASDEVAAVVEAPTFTVYGDSIQSEGALQPDEFLSQMAGKDTMEVTLEAKINQTCRVKGCWMTLDMGNGEEMRVSFKDYGFFVPVALQNKTVKVQGRLKAKLVDKESKEYRYQFVATGVQTL
jgi:hypothetical protein